MKERKKRGVENKERTKNKRRYCTRDRQTETQRKRHKQEGNGVVEMLKSVSQPPLRTKSSR